MSVYSRPIRPHIHPYLHAPPLSLRTLPSLCSSRLSLNRPRRCLPTLTVRLCPTPRPSPIDLRFCALGLPERTAQQRMHSEPASEQAQPSPASHHRRVSRLCDNATGQASLSFAAPDPPGPAALPTCPCACARVRQRRWAVALVFPFYARRPSQAPAAAAAAAGPRVKRVPLG